MFLFSLYVQNCYHIKFLLQKNINILMIQIFCVIWKFVFTYRLAGETWSF